MYIHGIIYPHVNNSIKKIFSFLNYLYILESVLLNKTRYYESVRKKEYLL